MSHSFGLISLGCSKNLVDSELIAGRLVEAGWGPKVEPSHADLLIINTCAFIDPAKQEAIDTIIAAGRAREGGESPKEQKIIVAGCLSQRYAKDLTESLPEVDVFMGLDLLLDVADIAQALFEGRAQRIYATRRSTLIPDFSTMRYRLTEESFSYVKISEGCNHACAFCVIPRIRGSHRSRPQSSIVREVRGMVAQGVREVNLIAQDTTYFGMDRWKKRATKTSGVDSSQGDSLATLLHALNEIEGDFWIRVLYTHPAHWSDELIDAFASCEKVVKYVDIPLQHISDDLLDSMRRETDGAYIRELLDKMRARVPGMGIRTTFISGLPGETEEHHLELMDFLREYRFERAGVFSYSREEGSLAAKMDQQVHHATKRRRVNALNMLQSAIADEIGQEAIGQTVRVLVDSPGVARGPWDAPDVDGAIHVDASLPVGEFADVVIADSIAYELFAEGAQEEDSCAVEDEG